MEMRKLKKIEKVIMQNNNIKNTHYLIAIKEYKANTMIIRILWYEINPNNNIMFQETSSNEKQHYSRLFSQKCVIITTVDRGHLYVVHSSPAAVKLSGLCGSSSLAVSTMTQK